MYQVPLIGFNSPVGGGYARVSIYPDRIEWVRPKRISQGHLWAAVLTVGLSLPFTVLMNRGARGTQGTEMIPVKRISSVTTSRHGPGTTSVSVITSGNTVDFPVSHEQAAEVQKVLTELILGTHWSQRELVGHELQKAALAPDARQEDVMAQLAKLGELRTAGVITDEEFDQKKAEFLRRL